MRATSRRLAEKVLRARPRAAKGRWPERAEWLRAHVLDLEVAALGGELKELDAADPWKSVVPKLCKPLQVIATCGCLAYGTRTTNMQQLSLALTHVVEPEQAKTLMRYWVEHRDHCSEDIQTEPARVLRASDEIVERQYKRQRRAGVPVPVWRAIDNRIANYYKVSQALLAEEGVRRAAIYVASLFFFWNKNIVFISSGYFGRSLQQKNFGAKPRKRPFKTKAAQLRELLLQVNIIREVTPADPKRHKAATYELLAPYWPPPFEDGPRRWHA